MKIASKFLPPEYLICPNCGGGIVFSDSTYSCIRCGADFCVENGIINLLPARLGTSKLNEERIWANQKAYDLEKIKRHEIRYFLDKILPMNDYSGKVLEIGAGSCWASALLKIKYPSTIVFASDISKSALRKGIEVSRSLNSNIDFFVACDSEKLPFKDKLFDYVYGNAVLHHFCDTCKGISEIHRVLKNDGSYIGSGELMANVALKRVWHAWMQIKEGIKERIFTFDEWLKIFYSCGFSDVGIRQNKDWRYKSANFPLTYVYYLTISSLPSSVVKLLATYVDLFASKS